MYMYYYDKMTRTRKLARLASIPTAVGPTLPTATLRSASLPFVTRRYPGALQPTTARFALKRQFCFYIKTVINQHSHINKDASYPCYVGIICLRFLSSHTYEIPKGIVLQTTVASMSSKTPYITKQNQMQLCIHAAESSPEQSTNCCSERDTRCSRPLEMAYCPSIAPLAANAQQELQLP